MLAESTRGVRRVMIVLIDGFSNRIVARDPKGAVILDAKGRPFGTEYFSGTRVCGKNDPDPICQNKLYADIQQAVDYVKKRAPGVSIHPVSAELVSDAAELKLLSDIVYRNTWIDLGNLSTKLVNSALCQEESHLYGCTTCCGFCGCGTCNKPDTCDAGYVLPELTVRM